MVYPYMFPEIVGGVALGVIVAMLMIAYLLIIALSVLFYILQSVSFQTIAKRRGIKHSWLAWIPVGTNWILGSISDQYQYVAKGKVRNRRKVLLGLSIAVLLLAIPYSLSLIVVCAAAEIGSIASVTGWTVAVIFCLLAMMAVSVAMTVFQYVALYDLYASCDTNQAVLYLLLSIFLPVTLPFLLMSCRKKDLGMPQRKPEPREALEVVEEGVSDEDFEEFAPQSKEEAQETLAGDFEEEGLEEAVEE